MTTRSTYDVTLADTTGMKRLITATQYARNPRGVTAAGWTGSGAGGAFTRQHVANGGPAVAPSFVRNAITAVPTGADITTVFGQASGFTNIDTADVGKAFYLSAYARCSKAMSLDATGCRVVIGWYDANGTFIANSSTHGAGKALAANTWTLLPNVSAVAPAGAAWASIQVNFPAARVNGGVAVGDTFDATGFLLTTSNTAYFDGDSGPGAEWTGTAHASRSTKIIGVG
ncbi:hypothetical protein ACF044_05000 [Microbacterium sp. NPDC016588]